MSKCRVMWDNNAYCTSMIWGCASVFACACQCNYNCNPSTYLIVVSLCLYISHIFQHVASVIKIDPFFNSSDQRKKETRMEKKS